MPVSARYRSSDGKWGQVRAEMLPILSGTKTVSYRYRMSSIGFVSDSRYRSNTGKPTEIQYRIWVGVPIPFRYRQADSKPVQNKNKNKTIILDKILDT